MPIPGSRKIERLDENNGAMNVQLTATDLSAIRSALAEVIIHLAFYAGWPRAMSAVKVAREVFKR